MSGINPLVWRGLGALGGLLALIGALVAWATDPRYEASLKGTELTEGKLLLAFAVVTLLVIVWRHIVGEDEEVAPWTDKAVSFLGVASVSRNSPAWAWVDRAVSLLGVAILIITITQWVDIEKNFHEDVNIGAGIYLALVGSLVLIASAVPSIVEIVNEARGSADEAKTSAAASSQAASQPGSAADDIEKLAGLLERGVLTQEEFDAKKKELLGL